MPGLQSVPLGMQPKRLSLPPPAPGLEPVAAERRLALLDQGTVLLGQGYPRAACALPAWRVLLAAPSERGLASPLPSRR